MAKLSRVNERLKDMSILGILGAAQQGIPNAPVEEQAPEIPAEQVEDKEIFSMELDSIIGHLGELQSKVTESAAARISKALDILEEIDLSKGG